MTIEKGFGAYPIGSSEESGLGSVGGRAVEAVGTHDQVSVAAPGQAGVEALALLQMSLLVIAAAEAAGEPGSRGATAPLEHAFPELQQEQQIG